MKDDSKERYGSVSKTFHWLMAALIGWQLFKFGDRIAEGEHWVGETLVPWHVSIGTLLLVLIVLRLAWVMTQRHQRPAQDPATAALVKAGHAMLYIALLLLPVLGILYVVGNGYPLTVFGIELIAKGDEIEWAKTIGGLHSPLAWLITALVIGHIAMALIHHFIKRDDTLKRML